MGCGKRKEKEASPKVKKTRLKRRDLPIFLVREKGRPLSGLTMQRPKVPLRRVFSPASKAGLAPCLAFLPSPGVI